MGLDDDDTIDILFVRAGTNDVKFHATAAGTVYTEYVFTEIQERLKELARAFRCKVVYVGAGIPGRGTEFENFAGVDQPLGGVGPNGGPRSNAVINAEIDRALCRLRQRVIEHQSTRGWSSPSVVSYLQLLFPGNAGENHDCV